MQERPSKHVLLTAIARFLTEEARPALTDPRLAFRALIAASLATIVAAELSTEDAQSEAELERLHAIVGEISPIGERPLPANPLPANPLPAKMGDRQSEIHALNAKLAALLQSSEPKAAMLTAIESHLMQTLRDKLAVDNPKFDTSLAIE